MARIFNSPRIPGDFVLITGSPKSGGGRSRHHQMIATPMPMTPGMKNAKCHERLSVINATSGGAAIWPSAPMGDFTETAVARRSFGNQFTTNKMAVGMMPASATPSTTRQTSNW